MYDPNDVIEAEIKGLGKVKVRLMTERHLQQFSRDTETTEGQQFTLPEHHERLNKALTPFLVSPDPLDLTLAQKLRIVQDLPWAVTNAELDRLKNPSASPSDSPTGSSANDAPETSAATT